MCKFFISILNKLLICVILSQFEVQVLNRFILHIWFMFILLIKNYVFTVCETIFIQSYSTAKMNSYIKIPNCEQVFFFCFVIDDFFFIPE